MMYKTCSMMKICNNITTNRGMRILIRQLNRFHKQMKMSYTIKNQLKEIWILAIKNTEIKHPHCMMSGLIINKKYSRIHNLIKELIKYNKLQKTFGKTKTKMEVL